MYLNSNVCNSSMFVFTGLGSALSSLFFALCLSILMKIIPRSACGTENILNGESVPHMFPHALPVQLQIQILMNLK